MQEHITVLGMDPSYANWGIAFGSLSLKTGMLSINYLDTFRTEKGKTKSVRTNSDDLRRCTELTAALIPWFKQAQVIFAEIPVGSQSANGMKAYGVCCGVLGSLQTMFSKQIIQVDPTSVKFNLTGKKTATKTEMIQEAFRCHPDANWPKHKDGQVKAYAEHMADAIASIYAGVKTPEFQPTLAIYEAYSRRN